MQMSIYLSNDVATMLHCYGTLNDVINKILIAGAEGAIDIMDKPKVPDKKGGHCYRVEIKEPNYLELIATFGTKSSRISLRRLLYWFVENEVYMELGWEPTEIYVDDEINKSYDCLMELKQVLYKTSKLLPQYEELFINFKNELNNIEEELWNV